MNEMDEGSSLRSSEPPALFEAPEESDLSAAMKQITILAWLHAEAVWHYERAVEDWQGNDERVLAENQRLADENDLLREELDKVPGGWEARVASRTTLRAERDALRAQLAATRELLRGMARRVGELRESMRFADAHVPRWERIICEHKAEIERLRGQLDRAVLVWPQDAMVRIRECIADPSRMLPRYHQSAGEPYETVAGWGARAVVKLMESWRAPVSESVPATPDGFYEEDEPVRQIVAAFEAGPKFLTAPNTSAAPVAISSGADLPEVEAAPRGFVAACPACQGMHQHTIGNLRDFHRDGLELLAEAAASARDGSPPQARSAATPVRYLTSNCHRCHHTYNWHASANRCEACGCIGFVDEPTRSAASQEEAQL